MPHFQVNALIICSVGQQLKNHTIQLQASSQINDARDFYNNFQVKLQNMYCDYQYFHPLQNSMMMVCPPTLHSDKLFQILSLALRKNLKQFSENKFPSTAQISKNPSPECEQAKINETEVIDLLSEQEFEKEQILHSKVQSLQNENNIHKSIQLQIESKESLEKSRQTDGSSQNLLQTVKHEVSRQNQREEIKVPALADRPYCKLDQDKLIFSVECPKLGLEREQLLRKKQSLLNRRVKDWSLVGEKSGKQKRQIKMLKN